MPAAIDAEDDRALVAFARRFLDAWERRSNRVDKEIGELERLYRRDGQ
jgi:hypothetical protein